jgi:hypothetical protein
MDNSMPCIKFSVSFAPGVQSQWLVGYCKEDGIHLVQIRRFFKTRRAFPLRGTKKSPADTRRFAADGKTLQGFLFANFAKKLCALR